MEPKPIKWVVSAQDYSKLVKLLGKEVVEQNYIINRKINEN